MWLSQNESKQLDDYLMSESGINYNLAQLMELAGNAVAISIYQFLQETEIQIRKIVVLCGPGNNGGDGLVAARFLHIFGFAVQVYYPRTGRNPYLQQLKSQLQNLNIPILVECPIDCDTFYVDGIVGFGSVGELKDPYKSVLQSILQTSASLFAIDVPSGWHVDDDAPTIYPDNWVGLISLTYPKKCSRGFRGVHYLGGRFVPDNIFLERGLSPPPWSQVDPGVMVMKLNI